MTPKELYEFYKAVNEGGEPQVFNEFTGEWAQVIYGPDLKSDIDEYRIRPKIDWLKIPVNTPIYVSVNEKDWRKRYFAAYVPNSNVNNKFVCFTNEDMQEIATGTKSWKYAKLMDEEQ